MADEAAQVSPPLDPRWRLAGAQHHRDGSAPLHIVDVDRQETALVIMRVEQRELLGTVDDIAGVPRVKPGGRLDVERHGLGLPRVGVHPGVDQGVGQPDHVAQTGSVLEARQPRLRAQVAAAVRQSAAGQLESGIGAQVIEIVGILVAAADREDAGPYHVGQRMGDAGRVAPIRDQPGQPRREAEAPFGVGQQHDTAIGHEAAAIEGGCDFFRPVAGKSKDGTVSSTMAGGAGLEAGGCRCKRPNTMPFQNLRLRPPPLRMPLANKTG